MGVVRSPKDLIAGLMFIAVGAGAIVIALNYTLGSAARKGPGSTIIFGLIVNWAGLVL